MTYNHGIAKGIINQRIAVASTCILMFLGSSMLGDEMTKPEVTEAAPANKQIWKPKTGRWYDWRDTSGEDWQAVDLVVSQGKERVTFLCHRAPVEPTEHFRAILFAKNDKGETIAPFPYSVGGSQKLEVYWYEPIDGKGPFLRLSEKDGEYLIDLKRKTTALIVRVKKRTFVGELGEYRKGNNGLDALGCSVSGDNENLEVSVAGGKAKEVSGPLASEKGKYIGKIRESGKKWGFYP